MGSALKAVSREHGTGWTLSRESGKALPRKLLLNWNLKNELVLQERGWRGGRLKQSVSACAKALWYKEWKEDRCGWRGERLERWPFFKPTVLMISLDQGCQIKCRMPSWNFQMHNTYCVGHTHANTYIKKLLVYLKLKFNWHSLFLFASDPTLNGAFLAT